MPSLVSLIQSTSLWYESTPFWVRAAPEEVDREERRCGKSQHIQNPTWRSVRDRHCLSVLSGVLNKESEPMVGRVERARWALCRPCGSSPRYGQAVQFVEGNCTLEQALVSPLLKDLLRCAF